MPQSSKNAFDIVFYSQKTVGILLLFCVAFLPIIANSSGKQAFPQLLDQTLRIQWGNTEISDSVVEFISFKILKM